MDDLRLATLTPEDRRTTEAEGLGGLGFVLLELAEAAALHLHGVGKHFLNI